MPLFRIAPIARACFLGLVGIVVSACSASAAIVVNISDAGPNVLLTYSGTLNLAGLTPNAFSVGALAGITSGGSILHNSESRIDLRIDDVFVSPYTDFNNGATATADTSSGSNFGVYSGNFLLFDSDNFAGNILTLNGEMTFIGTSVATFGGGGAYRRLTDCDSEQRCG